MIIAKAGSLLISLLFLFLFSSCLKEKDISLNYTTIQLPVNQDINKIYFENDSTIWVATGTRFGDGAVFLSTDKGLNWNQVLSLSQEIKDLHIKNAVLYVFPIGNSVYVSNDRGQNWQNLFMPGWEFFAAGTVNSENSILLVGGEGFGRGIMHELNTAYNPSLIYVDTISHELCDIEIIKDSTLVTVGYGVVLLSPDNGKTWIPNNVRGDFFRAVSFPDSQNGYVAGDFGTILKSTNSGQSWSTVKSGSTFFNEDERFNSIHFYDVDHGAIAGRKGLLWITQNAAKAWVPVNNLPEMNYSSVIVNENNIYIGAESGKILVVERP